MEKYTIVKTTPEFIQRIISTECNGKYGIKMDHFEKFYYKDGDKWCGCDNTDGNCWIEEFKDFGKCIAWLISEEDV